MFHLDLFSSLGIGAASKKRSQQVACYRAGEETVAKDSFKR